MEPKGACRGRASQVGRECIALPWGGVGGVCRWGLLRTVRARLWAQALAWGTAMYAYGAVPEMCRGGLVDRHGLGAVHLLST